jgi:hypothetical protein
MNAAAKSIKDLTKKEKDFIWIYSAKLWLNYFDELVEFFKLNFQINNLDD